LTSVKKNGYNAFITKETIREDPAIVIQLLVGPFTNRIAAQNKLAQLKTVGYQDAFIKTIDAQLLKPINHFEKGLIAPRSTDLLADEIDKIAQAVPRELPADYKEPKGDLREQDNALIPAELPTVIHTKQVESPAASSL